MTENMVYYPSPLEPIDVYFACVRCRAASGPVRLMTTGGRWTDQGFRADSVHFELPDKWIRDEDGTIFCSEVCRCSQKLESIQADFDRLTFEQGDVEGRLSDAMEVERKGEGEE